MKHLIEQKQIEVLYQVVFRLGKSINEVVALINEDTPEKRTEGNMDGTGSGT